MSEERYKIVRCYLRDRPRRTIKTGLTLDEAQAHCKNPETSSRTAQRYDNTLRTRRLGPWFDAYERD